MRATFKSEDSKSRIIGLDEVKFRTHWSKSKIYRYMKRGKFPPQAKKLEGSRSAGWYEGDIDDFIESLRPEPAAKDRRARAREVSQGEFAETDHPHRPLSLNPRNGTAPLRRVVKAEEDETLIRTGMKLQGQDVFCHLPSQRLLVAVGSMSEEYLAALGKLSA
jgi:predicted DNA-binding transcriptional regulator AlpA